MRAMRQKPGLTKKSWARGRAGWGHTCAWTRKTTMQSSSPSLSVPPPRPLVCLSASPHPTGFPHTLTFPAPSIIHAYPGGSRHSEIGVWCCRISRASEQISSLTLLPATPFSPQVSPKP
eukprot:144201-Rhodomonas_salina.4